MISTAAATAKALADAGITRVFGLPGGEVLVLMDELRRAGIDFVLMRRSSPQAAHRKRAKPPARQPHRRKSRNSCSTNFGSPSPSRSEATWARKVSKCSRTIP